MSCGDLRREGDGRWFFGRLYLGRDDEPFRIASELGDRGGFVASRLAAALSVASDELLTCGETSGAHRARAVLQRFERWNRGGPWA